MVEFERTDQEQVEQLRKWWQENWKPLIGGLVIGLGGILGWDQYQAWRLDRAAAASELYEAVASKVGAEDLAGARAAAKALLADHSSSPYAAHAKMVLAGGAAKAGEWDAAAGDLEWVIEQGKPADLVVVARLRLARVRWAAGDSAAALSLLEGPVAEAFAAAFAELRGDIRRSQGDLAAARSNYQQALESGAEYIDRALLQRKIDDLPASS